MPAAHSPAARMLAKVRAMTAIDLGRAVRALQADPSPEAQAAMDYVLAELERRMDPEAFQAFSDRVAQAAITQETAHD